MSWCTECLDMMCVTVSAGGCVSCVWSEWWRTQQHKHLLCRDVCSGASNSVTPVISNSKLRCCTIIHTRETSTLSCTTSTTISSSAQGPHQPQVNISQIPILSNKVLNLPIKPCHNQLAYQPCSIQQPSNNQPTTRPMKSAVKQSILTSESHFD